MRVGKHRSLEQPTLPARIPTSFRGHIPRPAVNTSVTCGCRRSWRPHPETLRTTQKPSRFVARLAWMGRRWVGVDSLTNSSPSYHSRTLSVSFECQRNTPRPIRPQMPRVMCAASYRPDGVRDGARKSRKKRGQFARARNHSSIPSVAGGWVWILKSPKREDRTGKVCSVV